MLDGQAGPKRSRRRSSRRRGNAVRRTTFCALAAGALVASVIVFGPSRQPAPSSTAHLEVDASLDPAVPVGEPRHPSRKVYPYSVIPGGVYTTTELADAAADDPTVAEHYADVTPTAMHVKVVDEVREAYMSYRIGDRIFWTKRMLPLREGERILSDGDVAIRARCGNRLSDVPRAPTSDVEPTAEEFEPAGEEFERDVAPLFPVGLGPESPIATGPPPGLWPEGSVPPGMVPTSDGGRPGGFFGGGGFYGDAGIPPIGGGGGTPGASEPNGEQPPIVFVLPPADGAGHPDPPDRGNHGDVPSVNVEIPGFTHVDRPGDGSGGSAGESPDDTWLVPETSGGSEGELPPSAVVPEPTTLTLLGTGL
jgi:hypothetical protein